jgi:DNA-binding MarR family transcriptional regulator
MSNETSTDRNEAQTSDSPQERQPAVRQFRSDRLMVELIDEVTRLRGRLFSAGRYQSGTPALAGRHWLVLCAVVAAPYPPTVARIGRSLGHPRQSIQRLASELENLGLIRFEDNPEHKRARLLVATGNGREMHQQQERQSLNWAEQISAGIDPALLLQTVDTLRTLRRRIERQVAHAQGPGGVSSDNSDDESDNEEEQQ